MSSQGAFSQLGIDTSNPTAFKFEFKRGTLGLRETIYDPSGMRGSRAHPSERVRTSQKSVTGQLVMEPGPEELAKLLPWVLGAAASGTTYALAETLSSRYVQVDRVAKVATYAGVYVNRATFEASEGAPLVLTLDLIGQTETIGNAGSFPAAPTGYTSAPFMLSDGAFSLVGSARSVKRFSLTVDNVLQTLFYNSLTATAIDPSDRNVTMDVTTPYTSSETDLYAQAVAGTAATVTFTNGAYSLAFALATWQVPAESPEAAGKTEVDLTLRGVARKLSTTSELIVTLDSTP